MLGVVPYDFAAARWHATLELGLRTELRHPDVFIAACAAAHGLTLVTLNGRDFRRMAAVDDVEDPLSLLEL